MGKIMEELNQLPANWQLTPVRGKTPYRKKWQAQGIDRGEIAAAIESGEATGLGLLLGKPSGYVVAIDFDGQSAIDLWLQEFGKVPHTVTWTSGKDGRYQALFYVPEAYWDKVKNKKIATGKDEQLEFRYTGNQSVLPPSTHPETSGYVLMAAIPVQRVPLKG